MPIGGSASWMRVTCPNHVTVPSLPPVKSPPSGITAHRRNAGTKARNGASRKTQRSALSGSRSSLKNSLMPSASVCSIPNGPALFGPIRFCMPGDDLALEPDHEHRADEADDEDRHDLGGDDRQYLPPPGRSVSSDRIGAEQRDHVPVYSRSIRTSVTVAPASTRSVMSAPSWLNGSPHGAALNGLVGDQREHDRAA